MTKPPPIVWRIAAAFLWIVSIVCLYQAVDRAEEPDYKSLSPADQIAIQNTAKVSDHWAELGWFLQFATAAVLSIGLKSPRIVRRVFVSLGFLITIDGIMLLLIAIIIR